jgi:two-component system cell cycle sensor histidine kinase/response regulator CckA
MEAVGKLAGGIAHDFNNVLTAIIGYSDLLLQTHAMSDPAYKDIKNIQGSAYRAAGMVRQLLSFSRRQTLQAESLLLDEVINENTAMLRTSLGEKITLKIQPSRDLWYVKVDKGEFARVVLNLTVNARDAMPDGGVLTIKTRNVTERESQKLGREGMPVGEYVAVEVCDTGTGMPPEVLEKIFEPFFTTKGVGKGTGLGLSTVYGIVKQSGGFIYAESTPGKGTTFEVFLPRFIPDAEEEEQAQQALATVTPVKDVAAKAPDLTGNGRVLLVEDEDVVRSFAVRALTRQGYEVLEASDGQEALDLVAANDGQIDIVVTDVVMPEMDGPTMFRELRKTNPSIKVIFVSGYPNEAFRETLGSEDVAFLPKPFSLPQLAEKVKQELAR